MAMGSLSTEREITKEFKEYVDAEIYKFKIDKCAGQLTFVFAFRKFQREWAQKYILENYKLKTITIGPSKVKKIRVFKPGFKLVIQKVKFHPELIKLLKDYSSSFDFDLDKYLAEMSHSMKLKDGAALEYADPTHMRLPGYSDVMFLRQQLPIWEHRKQFMRQTTLSQVSLFSIIFKFILITVKIIVVLLKER